MLTCIYCEWRAREEIGTFEKNKGSEEHALLSSLGGKKASRNICCQLCNNELGREIDSPFTDVYSHISTILDIKGDRRNSRRHRSEIELMGNDFDLVPGGTLELSKTKVRQEPKEDGSTDVFITASSMDEAMKIYKNMIEKHGLSNQEAPILSASQEFLGMPPPQLKEIRIGGELHMRAAAKMALTYLATMISPERLRDGTFSKVTHFIAKGDASFPKASMAKIIPIPKKQEFSEIDHRLLTICSKERKLAVGVLVLFGNIQYVIELSDQWSGPDKCKTYILDPISGKTREYELDVDAKTLLKKYRHPRTHDEQHVADGMESIFDFYHKKQAKAIGRSIGEEAKKTLPNNEAPLSVEEAEIYLDKVFELMQQKLSGKSNTLDLSDLNNDGASGKGCERKFGDED